MHHQASLANSFEGRHEILAAATRRSNSRGPPPGCSEGPTRHPGLGGLREPPAVPQRGGITIADATKLASQGKLKEGVGLPNPPLYYSLSDFVASAREGRQAACNAVDGMRATIVAIHAAKAAANGTEQTIDPSLYQI